MDSAQRTGEPPLTAGRARICSAAPDADALDRELARRLNEWPTVPGNGPDFSKQLRPVILKAALWGLTGCAGVVAAYFLFC